MTAADEPVRILLVDDLQENLIALNALLRREGLACDCARSGEEALELLLVKDYALAFLDVQMPGMDGFELAEFMRNSERSRHIPIIFVTAGAGDGTRRFKGYEAGAVDFIQKPIEADILRSKARVFLELYDQRKLLAAQRDELAALTESLRQADEQKNRFLAVLGHELRNPIMALSAGLIMLERRKGQPVEGEIRTSMERYLRHMTRLVEDLLDISRIEQGKISLKRERLDLNDVLTFAVDTTRPAIDEAGHTLDVMLPEGQVMLDADHARVAQIIGNLVSNAAKYTPAGGHIQITARVENQVVLIEVTDNGIGIPPDQQGRIFGIFEQADVNGKVKQDGLGIGLALVKQLVELHGGTIHLKRSAPGEGSTFEVCLPTVD